MYIFFQKFTQNDSLISKWAQKSIQTNSNMWIKLDYIKVISFYKLV